MKFYADEKVGATHPLVTGEDCSVRMSAIEGKVRFMVRTKPDGLASRQATVEMDAGTARAIGMALGKWANVAQQQAAEKLAAELGPAGE